MKDSKKLILIGIVIVLAILTIVVIILGNKDGNEDVNDPSLDNPDKISKEITKVNDYNKFFSIQNVINESLNINDNFIAIEMYTNNDKNLNYYFVGGVIIENNIANDTNTYKKGVYYIVLVDANNNYELELVNDNISNLENYANSYNFENKKINSEGHISSVNINEERVLTMYIEYYKNMLIYDTMLAYELLTEEAQNKYSNYEEFDSKKNDIYYTLSSKIFSYSKLENVYNIEDDNRTKITIYENGIMNFKIFY